MTKTVVSLSRKHQVGCESSDDVEQDSDERDMFTKYTIGTVYASYAAAQY